MNRLRLAYDFGIPSDATIAREEFIRYLAALYLLSQKGGISIEEEMFIEAWVDYLEVDTSWAQQAYQLGRGHSADVADLLRGIKNPALRQPLIRDALRVALLDGRIDPSENALLTAIQHSFDIQESVLQQIAAIVTRERQLLGMFQQLVTLSRPAVEPDRYFANNIDHILREQRLFLPNPQALDPTEACASIAFLHRLGGLTTRVLEEKRLLSAILKAFPATSETLDAALKDAWDLSLSSESLLLRVHDAGLRALLLRDSNRLLSLDGMVSGTEQQVLNQIAQVFAMPADTRRQLLQLIVEEEDLREAYLRVCPL